MYVYYGKEKQKKNDERCSKIEKKGRTTKNKESHHRFI
jgi:hypothetical protein